MAIIPASAIQIEVEGSTVDFSKRRMNHPWYTILTVVVAGRLTQWSMQCLGYI